MVKPEIRYSLWCGLFFILWYVVQYFLGFHTVRFAFAQYSGLLNYAILFIMLCYTLKEKRDDLKNNFSVQAGLRSGLIFCMILGWFYTGWLIIYNYYINPLWVEDFVIWQSLSGYSLPFFTIQNSGELTSVVMLSNTETHIALNFLGILIFGSIFSIFISIALNKKST